MVEMADVLKILCVKSHEWMVVDGRQNVFPQAEAVQPD